MVLNKLVTLALASCAALTMGACTPVGMAVGAGATAGIAAFQERPVGEALNDTEIKLGLTDRLLKSDDGLFSRVSTKVMEGRVMMTGLVERDDDRGEAARIAWTVPGVREVINEIEVSESSSLSTLPSDEWIDTKLSARLLTDFSISDINYATDVTNGSVYVLGIGQDEAEIDRVASHARDISGVRRVVMHAITVNDPRRMAARPAGAGEPVPFERQPSGERQGHVLAENQESEDLITGQPPLRTDMSAYDNAVAIETASTTPAYQPAPGRQPVYETPAATSGPRSISPGTGASGTIESRDLAPLR